MRFDYIFIALGVIAGAGLSLLRLYVPALFTAIPPMMWLLGAILLVDLVSAYARGVPVMTSVSTTTRVVAFCGGAIALIISGGGL
ncbi:MAG: hypothetical protein ACRCWF_05485 [Beijerinckiaceae bacterium]